MENIYKNSIIKQYREKTVSSIGYIVSSKDKIQERTRFKKRLYRIKKGKYQVYKYSDE